MVFVIHATFILYVYHAASDLDVCKTEQLELIRGSLGYISVHVSAPIFWLELYCILVTGSHDSSVGFFLHYRQCSALLMVNDCTMVAKAALNKWLFFC